MGILSTLTSIIIGKIIFYYIYELARKGINYFSGKSNHKDKVKKILDSISANKSVIADISKIVDKSGEMNSVSADRVVNIPYVKTQITKMSDSTNGELSETELENQLKTILIKSWNELGSNAVEKVKKDLK